MNRRSLSGIVLLAIFLVLPTAAFAAGTKEAAPATGPVEIKIWFGRKDFIPDDAFATFHKENPNIKVTADVIPLEQALTEFIPAYQARRAPDVLQLNHFNMIPLIRQNMLRNFGPVLDRWKADDAADFAKIAPIAFSLATWENVTYGMSMWAGPGFQVFRKDVFEKMGIPVPKTWEDVLAAARTVRSKDPNMLGMSIHGSRAHSVWTWFGSMYAAMGGQFVEGVMQLDSEEGIYLLEFHQALTRDKLCDPDVLALKSGDFRAAFIDGRAAQMYEAANIYPSIQKNMEYGKQWTAIIPPVNTKSRNKQVIAGYGWPFYVSARSENNEVLYKVFKYISQYSDQVSIRYQPPTRTSIFQDPKFLAAQPWWKDISGVYATMEPFPVHPRMPEMNQIVLDAMQWAFANPNGNAREEVKKFQAELNNIHAKK